jgi:hypothetical protein
VATARKMTVLAWHLITKDQDYAFGRPALVAHKRRKLELTAGAPSGRSNYQPGAAYNDKQRRNAETAAALFAQSGCGSPPALTTADDHHRLRARSPGHALDVAAAAQS